MTLLPAEAAGCLSCVASNFGITCGITSRSRWELLDGDTVHRSQTWGEVCRSEHQNICMFFIANLWPPATYILSLSLAAEIPLMDGLPYVPYGHVLYIYTHRLPRSYSKPCCCLIKHSTTDDTSINTWLMDSEILHYHSHISQLNMKLDFPTVATSGSRQGDTRCTVACETTTHFDFCPDQAIF